MQPVSRFSFNLKAILMVLIATTSFAQGDADVMALLPTAWEVALRTVNVALIAWLYLLDPTAAQVSPKAGVVGAVLSQVSGLLRSPKSAGGAVKDSDNA